MQRIIYYFWQICLLRAGPEGVPGNPFVLVSTFAMYFLMSLLTLFATRSDISLLAMVAWLLIGIFIEASIVVSLLAFKQVTRRFTATLSALLGANTVILIIMLPANLALDHVETDTMKLVAELVFLTTFLWWLAIAGFILHRAANISVVQGAAIAFGIEMLSLTVNVALFSPSV